MYDLRSKVIVKHGGGFILGTITENYGNKIHVVSLPDCKFCCTEELLEKYYLQYQEYQKQHDNILNMYNKDNKICA